MYNLDEAQTLPYVEDDVRGSATATRRRIPQHNQYVNVDVNTLATINDVQLGSNNNVNVNVDGLAQSTINTL